MFIPDVLPDEVSALRDATAGLFQKYASEEDLRQVITTGSYDRELWSRMAAMGLHGLGIPEELGGVGGGPVESFVAFREAGRVLLSSPFFASVGLAANLLAEACERDAQEHYLPLIASGSMVGTVAMSEGQGSWNPADVVTTVETDGRLSGIKTHVPDAANADVLLVVARHRAGIGVFAVDPHAEGAEVAPLTTLDLTRPMADVRFDRAAAVRLSGSRDQSAEVTAAVHAAALALTAEQLGGAESVMQASLDYARTRVQFGRTIGSFQAIKHKLADMAFDLERMTSAGWHAARSAAGATADQAIAIHVAQAFCSEAYFRLAAENIQIHGGIGFTWEHPAHLYFRRAKASEVLCGNSQFHRDSLFKLLVHTALSPAASIP